MTKVNSITVEFDGGDTPARRRGEASSEMYHHWSFPVQAHICMQWKRPIMMLRYGSFRLTLGGGSCGVVPSYLRSEDVSALIRLRRVFFFAGGLVRRDFSSAELWYGRVTILGHDPAKSLVGSNLHPQIRKVRSCMNIDKHRSASNHPCIP